MWNNSASVSYINSHAEPESRGNCAAYVRRAVEAGGVKIKIPPPRIGGSASACDYGPSFEAVGFKPVYSYAGSGPTDTAVIPGQQAGDVVVIQPIDGHPHGHIALFNGTNWVSDFIQLRGFYPGQQYRNIKPAYILYRYTDDTASDSNIDGKKQPIKIVWPILSNNRGKEFSNQEDILSHLAGESTGQYAIGRSGMWHGGIHITHTTTPWCALSGKAPLEAMDFPVLFKGEQAVRCMADGEVVAYRVCKDYMTIAWESGPLSFSGSFVLVKHYIQPGKEESSGLHFYTLYMHLAPYSAYESEKNIHWITQDTLSGYSEADWLIMDLSRSDKKPASAGNVNKGTPVTWDASDTSLTATHGGRTYGLATLNADSGKLKSGQRVWMLVDNNNIKPAPGSGPAWWDHLVPPAKEVMVFDKTVSLSSPFAIKAGDPIGHMGYYQAPKDGGYEARYQVHIECTSMDDNLEKFLTNPEKVGETNPLWLKYSPGLALYTKDVAKGTFAKGTTSTTRTGILPLSKVATETDKSTKQEYWLLRPENAYVPKGQAEPQLLSQYDLAKLGFRTETAEPASFDYLDGKNQPVGFFRSLINSLYEAATGDTRTSHALVKHNYQRLLDKIDNGNDRYSPMEYWRALHNPDYRDVIQKTIVKHPSDWYFKKGDAIWQPFLNALKKDAPEWKKYSEDFLDKMAWMQDVTTEKLGPSLWHMHPIMFLGALKPRNDIDWSKLTKQQFTDAVYETALKEQEKSGIPAAITTAQAIDESGYGRKVPVDLNNKTYSFNLFGIKAKSGQEFVEIWTTEHINGSNIKIKDKFAAYNSFEESIADRTRFLTENKRYASLFESYDPEKWAHGLQDKGYATDPNYASKLISIMKGSYMKGRGLK
ncbi:TPA: glycoside hydrolase family 73 protein [Enterobacter cloacae]|uniref:glycoside hydrolase family 73 protein n=1 Tax=Enterobacter cloacae complex TaxID=354276 RepID=UPI0020055376|nr:glucosaminidase domain-containing protein [Enterobacter cloacae]HBM7664757.1 glucosaminidase domain-containing protein [Enterobacter cloacae subsp. cloacae]MCK6805593.1 glucosaminidase domain-containing protein [Enterobacter cloacae]MCK6826825.1 glucosaminidase domain-containing protein [Enterobacter cloacae]MCM7171042.1 glucosaminidase domain-containing protein [Enterobacter cloacae]MDT0536099.1 glucosaminidase domain-containing protein [Enterobacter cloacae]